MIKIIFEPDENRSAAYDGEKLIGVCEVETEEKYWTITHTEINSAYACQGLARKLVDCVCEQAKAEKVNLAATCSYADKVLNRV